MVFSTALQESKLCFLHICQSMGTAEEQKVEWVSTRVEHFYMFHCISNNFLLILNNLLSKCLIFMPILNLSSHHSNTLLMRVLVHICKIFERKLIQVNTVYKICFEIKSLESSRCAYGIWPIFFFLLVT